MGTSNAGVYLTGAPPTKLNLPSRTDPADKGSNASAPVWNAKARKHYRAALRLMSRAELLYEDAEELEAAAELLYMAAKQAINAVANSRSSNPITTRAKYRRLKRIARGEPDGAELLALWDAARRLHTYADQMPDLAILEQDWRSALEFITRMLALLPPNAPPDSGSP